jgi:hypothetical protein
VITSAVRDFREVGNDRWLVLAYVPTPAPPAPALVSDCCARSTLASSFDVGSKSGPRNVRTVGARNHIPAARTVRMAMPPIIHTMTVPFIDVACTVHAQCARVVVGESPWFPTQRVRAPCTSRDVPLRYVVVRPTRAARRSCVDELPYEQLPDLDQFSPHVSL